MRRALAAALAAATVTACGGQNGPGPLPQPAPQITCGGAVSIDNVTTLAQTVSYAPPIVSGGAPPVTVSCSPASGAEFSLGETTVTCTVSDAQNRQATCSFAVTLRHRPFALTRYLSFGDSLTAGENGRPVNFVPFIDVANAYPTVLQRLFLERVPGQQITVVNEGLPGEKVEDNDSRLKGAIARLQPQVLLLLEGINDLNAGGSPQRVVDALRDNIRTAHERGAQYVFVSTLLPVAPENCGPPAPRCRGLDTTNAIIAAANHSIRGMVPGSGAHLVDPFDTFNANRAAFIDVDGLHLRPEGNRALADAFWSRIVEVIPGPQLTGSPAIGLR